MFWNTIDKNYYKIYVVMIYNIYYFVESYKIKINLNKFSNWNKHQNFKNLVVKKPNLIIKVKLKLIFNHLNIQITHPNIFLEWDKYKISDVSRFQLYFYHFLKQNEHALFFYFDLKLSISLFNEKYKPSYRINSLILYIFSHT